MLSINVKGGKWKQFTNVTEKLHSLFLSLSSEMLCLPFGRHSEASVAPT